MCSHLFTPAHTTVAVKQNSDFKIPTPHPPIPPALIWIHSETLILAAGLTDIISGMPLPPEKMKKTDHYVRWQQLKQLHKATYVGSYKLLVSGVGLRVSAWLWTFLAEPTIFGRDFNGVHKTQPTQTDAAGWKGTTQWRACRLETCLWDYGAVRGCSRTVRISSICIYVWRAVHV